MKTSVNFFSDGFFGYCESQDFYIGSIYHILPIVLMIAIILLIYKYKDKIRESKYETRIRYALAFIMMIVEMSYFWRLLYVGSQGTSSTMMGYLPLQICQWGLLICIFTIISKNKNLFGINFYVTLLFASIALIYPVVIIQTGPRYYRYYQFWLEHMLPIICVFYLMFVHNMKPQYKSMYHATLVYIPLVVFALIANNIFEDADYLFLSLKISFLPQNQILRTIIIYLLGLIVFHLMYFGFKKLDKKLLQKK